MKNPREDVIKMLKESIEDVKKDLTCEILNTCKAYHKGYIKGMEFAVILLELEDK